MFFVNFFRNATSWIAGSLAMIFVLLCTGVGTGNGRQESLSKLYQTGVWSGESVGTPVAEVKNGLLYVDNKISSYPADSSRSYYCEPIYSSNYGTWFKGEVDRTLRLDRKGVTICEYRLIDEIWGCNKWNVVVDEANNQLVVEAIYDMGTSKEKIKRIEFPLYPSN